MSQCCRLLLRKGTFNICNLCYVMCKLLTLYTSDIYKLFKSFVYYTNHILDHSLKLLHQLAH